MQPQQEGCYWTAGLCPLGGLATPRTPSSAAMTTSGRQWQSGRTTMLLSCSTGWTGASRRLRGRALGWASSEGSWSSFCSAGMPSCRRQLGRPQVEACTESLDCHGTCNLSTGNGGWARSGQDQVPARYIQPAPRQSHQRRNGHLKERQQGS